MAMAGGEPMSVDRRPDVRRRFDPGRGERLEEIPPSFVLCLEVSGAKARVGRQARPSRPS